MSLLAKTLIILKFTFFNVSAFALTLAPFFEFQTQWNRYSELSDRLQFAWIKEKAGAEQALKDLNDYLEPDALKAFSMILSDPNRKIYWGSYNLEPDAQEEIPSSDGMAGLRVIIQTHFKDPQNRKRLVSSILTYEYNAQTNRLELRLSPDAIRVRFELEPVGGKKKFVGFSWTTRKNAKGELELASIPYISEEVLQNDRGKNVLFPGLRYPKVTAASFSNHCNACHHRTIPNVIEHRLKNEPGSLDEGRLSFIESLKTREQNPSWELVAQLSLSPVDLKPLKQAVRERVKTLKR